MKLSTSVILAVLLCSPSFAQDLDAIELKCAQSKLKAAGKSCACIHKAWTKAAALGVLPDLSACDEKLETSFDKAEEKATADGGVCAAGESAAAVSEALAEAADKTVTQVGRGTVSPAPDACDGVFKPATYSGGNYGKLPKCINLQVGDTSCSDWNTQVKFSKVVEKDFKCPGCPEGEEGCTPDAAPVFNLVQTQVGKCCLQTDALDSKKSVGFSIMCTVCTTP